MERVIAYIDGFNLYYGLKSKGWKRYYWLDVQKLVQNLLKPSQSLMTTKYFTSRIGLPADKQKRQATYLEALENQADVSIFYGKYQNSYWKCQNCGFENLKPSEKMSDVNIAVEMLQDGFENRFDTAMLISADGDLTAPVKKVRQLFSDKRVVVVFPPARRSMELEKVANAHLMLGRGKIAASLLPLEIFKADGFILKCPATWQ